MASNVSKSIEIIFKGVDNVSGTISGIGSSVESFGDGLQNIGEPFADLTKQVALLDAAIIGLGVAALKASADIDSETRKMANSLGLPIVEAEKFSEVAQKVYTAGFGEDLAQAFEVATIAQKRFGDNAENDIGKITEQALVLQSTFGTEFEQSLGAVQTLMTNFGLSSSEAFDFIAAGFQKGLDRSGDFLESITEYSVQFNNGGADAGQFFSILETGLQDGVLGTDKAADAFKEFRVRIQDGSKLTAESLAQIGIDPAELERNLQSGVITVADAFTQITDAIGKTEDKSKAFQAGVGLLGTQFEDLGQEAVAALDLSKTKLDELQGTISRFETEDLGKSFTKLYRTIATEISSASLWDDAKEKLAIIFGDIAESFPAAFADVDFSELIDSVQVIWDQIADIFISNEIDLTTVEGMKNAIQLVVDSIESLADVTSGLIEIFEPLVSGAIDAAKWFNELDEESKNLAGNILALGSALTVVGGIVAVGGKLIGGIGSFIGLAKSLGTTVTGLGPSLAGVGAKLGGLGTAIAGSTAGMASLSLGVGVAAGSLIRLIPGVDEATQGIFEFTDEIFNWTGTQQEASESSADLTLAMYRQKRAAIEASQGVKEATESVVDYTSTIDAGAAREWAVELSTEQAQEALRELTGLYDTLTTIERLSPELATDDLINDIDGVKERLVALQDIGISLDVDTSNLKNLENEIPEDQEVTVWTNADIESARKAEKDIKETVPEEQDVKLKAKLDREAFEREIAELEAKADVIQASFEYKAKVDVAEIEAAARITEAAFSSIGVGLESSAQLLGTLAASLGDVRGQSAISLRNEISAESRRRDREIDLQEKLIEAQIEAYESQRDAAERGDALIQVDGTGLQPHLEAIMWEILAAIQVRANEEGQAALIGLSV